MSLMFCPECNREISDRAAFCPGCGYPNPGTASRFSRLSVGQVFSERSMGWRVLDVDSHNNRALVITQDIIAYMSYHQEFAAITWADCTLRRWLNNGFFNCLSPAIKSRVQTVINQNNAGGATWDEVFLLSVGEARAYFNSDVDRVETCNGSNMWWWLRSQGYYDNFAAHVYYDGSVDAGGYDVSRERGVRPALWLNLQS